VPASASDRVGDGGLVHRDVLVHHAVHTKPFHGDYPDRGPVDMLAHMILGALSEAARALARSPHPKEVLKDGLREFDILIEGVTRRPEKA